MRDANEGNITEAVIASFAATADPRLKQILTSLVRHLHGFAREVELTHAEWGAAMDFLYKAARKTSRKRHEFILVSDVLGLSSLVDMMGSRGPAGTTERSVLGPFYIPRAPMLSHGGDLIRDNPGDPVLMRGRVHGPDAAPIEGAQIEVWQNAANGLYSNQDPAQHPDNLRCRMITAADGRYEFTTIRPVPYTVPTDGPVGTLLAATGRHPWRTAHVHFRVTAKGYNELVTELYPADDPYIDADAVFGVRASLAVPFRRNDSAEDARRHNLAVPFWTVDYDFGLSPAG